MDGQERIDSVFAFIVIDDDGTEGIPTLYTDDIAYPMIGADLARVAGLTVYAKQMAELNGKAVKLVHFSQRTVQEIYEPDGSVTKPT